MKTSCLYFILMLFSCTLTAQVFCPPNINLELGNFNNWNCFIATNTGTGVYNWTATPPYATRHSITSGVSIDPYGGFPITAPGGGLYAAKLGNDNIGGEMDRMQYVINIPPGASNYSLIYRYGVVFENPASHTALEQPFFKVAAYNASNGAVLPCNNNTFVAAGNLPGFIETSPGSNIWYKEWTTASLRLNGLGGQTVIIEFTASDCGQSGHFGYGYLDMSCSTYAITSANCNASTNTQLIAPPGFQLYTWYDSAMTTSLGSGQTITVPTPATTTYYKVVLYPYPGYGCIDTLTSRIQFSTLTVNATPDSSALCSVGSIQLNTTQMGSAPPYTYVWTPTPGLSCSYCPNPIASPSANTTYTVAVTDSIGCTVRDSVKVTAGMTVTGSQSNAACANSHNGTATVNVTGGTPPYTYSWNTVPVQTVAAATGLLPGTYTCTITDASNCTATRTVTIGVTAMTLSQTHTNVFCAAATNGGAIVTPIGGTAPYTYSWNTTPVQTSSAAGGLGPGTYTCTATDAWGCVATATIVISVTPFTLASTQSNVLCNGQNNGSATVTLPANSPIAAYTYSWNTTPVQTTAAASNLPAGTYTVTVTDGTCTTTKVIPITQPTALSLTGSSTNIYCRSLSNGTAAVLATGGSSPYTYSWNTSPVQTTPSINGLIDGTYVCRVTDAHGCMDSVSRTIIQTAPLSVAASIVSRACSGRDNNIVTATPAGGTGAIGFSWNNTPPGYTQTIGSLPSGSYRVIVTDAVGCTAKDSVTVISYASPVITASGDVDICLGDTVTLNVSGTTFYSWTPVSGLSCNNCTAPKASPTVTTNYMVVGKDANNCTDTAYVLVTVIGRNTVTVDSGRSICSGDQVMLGATGGMEYAWTPSESLQGPFLSNPVASPVSTTTYQVIIRENKCFTDTLTQTITVMPLPTVDAGNSFTGITGATVQLNATTSNAKTITWSPPKWLSCYDCPNPVATLTDNVIYLVEVTDTFGCKARDTLRIDVGCNSDAFFMANTFTPNNDGKNDWFYPQAFGINTVSRFMIYNRWGQVVFSAQNIPANVPERGWNGMFNGKDVVPDVFLFAIEAICGNGQPVVLKGDVTLVR